MKAAPVLVHRLLRQYDPFAQFFAHRPTLTRVRKAAPVEGYAPVRPEHDAGAHSEFLWDLGRVRFFVDLLDRGCKLDPISADWRWEWSRPVRFVLTDGHHRLCAAWLKKLRLIDVSYSGPVDFLKYLTGERKLPKEYA